MPSFLFFLIIRPPPTSTLFPYTTLFRSSCSVTMMLFLHLEVKPLMTLTTEVRSEERFSRNAETDLVCRLLLEKKKISRRCGLTAPDRSTMLAFSSQTAKWTTASPEDLTH